MTDDGPLELKLARAAYAEAEQIKKAAEQDRAAAEYERGQVEHRHRKIMQIERGIAEREKRLVELGEAKPVAREKAADDKLKQAQQLMKAYDKDRHAAAIALTQINEREKAERSEAA